MTHSRVYRIWWDMLRRCSDKKAAHYDRYGGRGITVCKSWSNSFVAFYRDMGDPPKGATLDRIKNELGYCPSNCKWSNRWEQSVNRSDNVMMTVGGVTKPIAVWVKERGLPYDLVYYRKCIAKWPDEECLAPAKQKQPVSLCWEGNRYTVKEIATALGISVISVHSRIKAGWPVEEIINRPNSQPYKKTPRINRV